MDQTDVDQGVKEGPSTSERAELVRLRRRLSGAYEVGSNKWLI
jgi:hypothetical protein